jgi:sentrin-specific protease 1
MKSRIQDDESDSSIEETSSPVLNSPPSSKSTPRQSSLSILSSQLSTSQTLPISSPESRLDSQSPPTRDTSSATSTKAKSPQIPENIPLPESPTLFKFGDQNAYSQPSAPVTFHLNLPDQSTPKNNLSSFASSTPTISPTPTRIPADSSRPSSTDRTLQSNVMPNMRKLNLGHSLNSSVATSSDIESQTSRRSSQSSKRDPLRRNPRHREHIFAKVHKAHVQRQKLELREQLKLELFDMKRREGV